MSQKVFLLENDKWLGDQYQQSLEAAKFKVVRTNDAYDAMDMIDNELPGVIVMSLLLSGAGAMGLLHELQSYVDTAKIPVIICTTQTNVTLEDLEPYGVKRLLNSSTMKTGELASVVRSVLA